MAKSIFRPISLRALVTTSLAFMSIFIMNVSYAKDIWKLLEREGNAIELMAIDSIESSVVLVGAKYEQQQWQVTDDSDDNKIAPSVIRKQLHIIKIDKKESVEWQHSFSAMPDVNEIFSVSSTSGGRLCIAYGRYYHEGEFINPIMLQVDSGGKILWAIDQAIQVSNLHQSRAGLLDKNGSVQVANLDSIRIIDTPENGCLLGYILRRQSDKGESYELHLQMTDSEGKQKWNYIGKTKLYGKMFLIRNKGDNQYTVVQTNQSRDAAIEAMMAASPYLPETSIKIISLKGKLKASYENIVDLSKVWIKAIMDVPGDSIMLVGNSSNAWMGQFNATGHISNIFNTLGGEFSFVSVKKPAGYLLVREDSLVVINDAFTPAVNQPINSLISKKYSNPYMDKQIRERVPVQNIVPLQENTYLMLYKLGSRLLKINLLD
jgi:hypothetical protein